MSQLSELIYLALGDSYTIGTGATHESRNFPSLLALQVQAATGRDVRVVNPAVNGFTTVDVLAREIGFIDQLHPDFVTVLIGVNDLVRGRSVEQYRESLVEIYEAIATVELPRGRVAALSIPDWSVAPSARDYGDPLSLKRSTDAFNAVARPQSGEDVFEEAVKLRLGPPLFSKVEDKSAERSLGFFRLKGEFAAFLLRHGGVSRRDMVHHIVVAAIPVHFAVQSSTTR